MGVEISSSIVNAENVSCFHPRGWVGIVVKCFTLSSRENQTISLAF